MQAGAMPAKVPENMRPIVTFGLANEVCREPAGRCDIGLDLDADQ